jgi:hypothetical protein
MQPDVGKLLDALDDLAANAERVRHAPLPLDEQLSAVRHEVEATAAAFRRAPWSPQTGLRGAMAAIVGKQTLDFELAQVRLRVSQDIRKPFGGPNGPSGWPPSQPRSPRI